MIGDAAQTGNGISAFGGGAVAANVSSIAVVRPGPVAPVLLLLLLRCRVLFVAVPQMFHVHNLEQKLRNCRVVRVVGVLVVEVVATRRGRRRRRAPLGRIHRPWAAAVSVWRQQNFAACRTANFTTNSGWRSRSAGYGISTLVSAPSASSTILADGCEKTSDENQKFNCVKKKLLVTFQFHAGVEAFFESASRALFAGGDSDRAGSSPEAHIVLLILDGSFEEALAALARKDAVMEARDLVTADRTRTVDQLLARNAGLGGQRCRVLGKVGRVQTLLFTRSFAAVFRRVIGGQSWRMDHVRFTFDLQVSDAWKRSGRSGTGEWSRRVSIEKRRWREFAAD